jgi:hypothetical protein
MGMMRQRLPPCVQDGDDANLGAEPTRIGGERRHRLGGGLEQDRVNDGLVLEGDRGDRRRQRKDDVEIGNRKQVCFPRGKPRGSGWPLTLRTVTITAGIIGDASHAAVVASLYVAAERLGSARNDRAHYASLDATEMAGMVTTIGVAMPTQDIGNLQANARHSSVDGGPVRADVGTGHDPHPDAGHPGGVTSSDRRSSGLCVARIVSVATCV